MPFIIILLIYMIGWAGSSAQQVEFVNPLSRMALDDEDRDRITARIESLLVRLYVEPHTGSAAAEFIRERYENGRYDSRRYPDQLARALTSDLQEVTRDKHLRLEVVYPAPDSTGVDDPLVRRARDVLKRSRTNFGFIRLEILEGNIGYVNIWSFEPPGMARHRADQVMGFLADADAVIIDLRENEGGSPDMVRYLCSYFFDRRVHLNSLYWRDIEKTEEYWTLDHVGGIKRPDVPLYVLTGRETFSAGEEFAYNMQTRKRGIVIGEVTGGGANPGFRFRVHEYLRVFIPVGRAINPVTGTNWEGVGVTPDVETPAEQALNIALSYARKTAESYRRERKKKMIVGLQEIREQLGMADSLMTAAASDTAARLIAELISRGYRKGWLDEYAVNWLGYEYLDERSYDTAIKILTCNVEQYPRSANVYDSLGEAYMKKGNSAEAVYWYRKSLEVDPGNENAREMLDKLGARAE